MTYNDLVYKVALTLIPRVGDKTVKKLINHFKEVKNIYNASLYDFAEIAGMRKKTAQNLLSAKNYLPQAQAILDTAQKSNTQLLFYGEETYPSRLIQFDDTPALLYYNGISSLNHPKTISIVGTRKATRYGKEMVSNILHELVEFNPLVISGLAYGIDIHAHKTALNLKLETVGVLASGLDIIYPSSHFQTAQCMKLNGGLISENTFGSKPDAPKFPARNRIIAALSDLVIVIEAASKGGALITANIANDYGIEVMAVPGNLENHFSTGCNKLIKEHKAHILSNPNDIPELLGWEQASAKNDKTKKIDIDSFNIEERLIISSFDTKKELTIDELFHISKLPLNTISSTLLLLEFQNIISALPGNKFSLII